MDDAQFVPINLKKYFVMNLTGLKCALFIAINNRINKVVSIYASASIV